MAVKPVDGEAMEQGAAAQQTVKTNSGPLLAPDDKLREFMKGLSKSERPLVTFLLYVALEALSDPVDGRLEEYSLYLLEEVAREHDGQRYREVMDRVVKAAMEGREGLNAAFMTVNRLVELGPMRRLDSRTSARVFETRVRAARRLLEKA